MKISIVQADILWENKSENFRRLESLILNVPKGSDIIILPEMFNTGFSMKPEMLSEPARSETFDWMMKTAKKYDAGICGSYIVSERQKFFNRWVFAAPDGKSWEYDKRHLFRMDEGEKSFAPGKKRLVFNFRDVRILPNVCYDLRFPVWSRNRNDYDLLINSANWPSSRSSSWDILLKARAIENQCFVAGANRTGEDGAGIRYNGGSMLINPRGEIISEAEGGKEAIISGEIFMDELYAFREKFPVKEDSDQFTITL